MKKLILSSIAAILIATSSFATEEEPRTQREVVMEVCNSLADFAETAMTGRQTDGISFQDLLKFAQGHAYTEAILMVAWQRPRYHSPAARLRAIQEFKDEAFVWCYQTYK